MFSAYKEGGLPVESEKMGVPWFMQKNISTFLQEKSLEKNG